MKTIANKVYLIHTLTIYCILDLRGNVCKEVKTTYYMSAGFASRHAVGDGDLTIDIFLEVQKQKI